MSCLAVEVDPARIEKRLATRYVDERIDDLDEALAPARRRRREAGARRASPSAPTPPRSTPSSSGAASSPTS